MAITQQDKEEMYQYLISKGVSVTALPDGSADLSDKYLSPVIEYAAGGAKGKLVRLAVSTLKGDPGKEIKLKTTDTHIQWQLGDGPWINLVAIATITGDSLALRQGEAGIEWKLSKEDDSKYRLLVDLPSITGDKTVLRKGATGIEWKYAKETDVAYKLLVALADLKGNTGDSIMLRKTATSIEWKKSSEADTAYKSLVTLSDLKGAAGDNLVLRKGATNIEWKLSSEADALYKALIAVSDLKGNAGESVMLRKTALAIEWKLANEADTAYRVLVNLPDLKGPKGDAGKNFHIEGYYNTLSILQGAVPNPAGGATYGVGVSAPYQLYIYDAVQKRWVDNGTIGQNGAGSGNVYADPTGLTAGKKYLFVPGTDNSTTGTYKELSLADLAPAGYEFLFAKKEV